MYYDTGNKFQLQILLQQGEEGGRRGEVLAVQLMNKQETLTP